MPRMGRLVRRRRQRRHSFPHGDRSHPYDLLVQDALRSVVPQDPLPTRRATGRRRLRHFNIAFKTQAPGVVPGAGRGLGSASPTRCRSSSSTSSRDLRLVTFPDAFEVSLNFSRKPERLTVPFDSITGFADPSSPVRISGSSRRCPEPAAAVPLPATVGKGRRRPRQNRRQSRLPSPHAARLHPEIPLSAGRTGGARR